MNRLQFKIIVKCLLLIYSGITGNIFEATTLRDQIDKDTAEYFNDRPQQSKKRPKNTP